MGHAVAQLVEALRYKSEGRGFDSQWCQLNFSQPQSFRPHYGLGVESASNRNEYQEYFLGVKAADAQAYHLHVPTVLKSGSLNLLEPSGPVQAYNGITLPSFTLSEYRLYFVVEQTNTRCQPLLQTADHYKWVTWYLSFNQFTVKFVS